MFYYCNNFSSNIYFNGNIYRNINIKSMLGQTNNSLQKNVYFNSILNNVFNKTDTSSIIGSAITWIDMEDNNGFYNEIYNIYCYNNYRVVG